MSYSQQQQQRQLSQEQSKIADNLPWGEEKTKWKESRNGKKYPLKWKECTFDSAGLEAVQMFHGLNLGEKERVLSSSGLYTYGVGKDRLFQSKPFTARKRTPEEQQQLEQDRAGLEGRGVSSEDKWDKIHARQEERDKDFEQRHQESQILFRALLDEVALLKEEIKGWREDENRREHIRERREALGKGGD